MAEQPAVPVARPGFVGRNEEIKRLHEALVAAPAVVFIEGEAGAGKSRLLHEYLSSAEGGGPTVMTAWAPPFPESLTLGPLVGAVLHLRDDIDDLGLSPLAGALRPLFPEWRSLPDTPEPLDDPRVMRHRLFRAFDELLDAIGVDVLALEDAHWADETTLAYLLHVDASPRARPMSLVLTYRPEDVPETSLVWRLGSRSSANARIRISLAPLSVADTALFVSSMVDGDPVSQRFAEFLHRHTSGLPLAIEESVRLMGDRKDLVRRNGEWSRRSLEVIQVPPTVRDSVLERVQRLGPDAQQVLQAAAVLIEPSRHTFLAATAVSGTDADAGLTQAIASGLLEEGEDARIGFRHALMGRAVYEATPSPVRRQLHRRAAEVLQRLAPRSVTSLARHFRAADQPEQWHRYAELAADEALATNNASEAAAQLHEVLTSADLTPADRGRLARKLGESAVLRVETVDDLHRRTLRLLTSIVADAELAPEDRAEIRNRLARLLMQSGDFEVARTQLELAVDDLADNPLEAARVMTLLGLPLVGPSPAQEHRAWLQRAEVVGRQVASDTDRFDLTADRIVALLHLGDETAWSAIPELSEDVPARSLARMHSNLVGAAVVWGRYAAAAEYLRIAREAAETVNYQRIGHTIALYEAKLDWFAGRWAGLDERIEALVARADLGLVHHASLESAAYLHLARGRREQASTLANQALTSARKLGQVQDMLGPGALLAQLQLESGDAAPVRTLMSELIGVVRDKGTWIWATDIAPVYAEMVRAAGDTAALTRLVAEFEAGLGEIDAPAAQAALATCRAILARATAPADEVAAAFTVAADAWRASERRYDELQQRWRVVEVGLAAANGGIGQELGLQVHQSLLDLGATREADRVAATLREHAVDVPRPWRGGRHGYGRALSPRELEVVRLVASGLTNREIADALFRSPRTIEAQLRSAMRKLGVSSRTAAAMRAVEEGIVDAP